jgi:metallophosphoesterase superfamily enzyme
MSIGVGSKVSMPPTPTSNSSSTENINRPNFFFIAHELDQVWVKGNDDGDLEWCTAEVIDMYVYTCHDLLASI